MMKFSPPSVGPDLLGSAETHKYPCFFCSYDLSNCSYDLSYPLGQWEKEEEQAVGMHVRNVADVTGAQGSTAMIVKAVVIRARVNVQTHVAQSAPRKRRNASVLMGLSLRRAASALNACLTTTKMPQHILTILGVNSGIWKYVSGRAYARDANFVLGPTVLITKNVNARFASLKITIVRSQILRLRMDARN